MYPREELNNNSIVSKVLFRLDKEIESLPRTQIF